MTRDLTTADVCAAFNVTRVCVQRWLSAGLPRDKRAGPDGIERSYFSADEIRSFMARGNLTGKKGTPIGTIRGAKSPRVKAIEKAVEAAVEDALEKPGRERPSAEKLAEIREDATLRILIQEGLLRTARVAKANLELAKMRGELIELAEAQRGWGEIVVRARERVMAVPPQIASELVGRTEGEIEEQIEAALRRALTEAST